MVLIAKRIRKPTACHDARHGHVTAAVCNGTQCAPCHPHPMPLLLKTDKARHELSPGVRTLSLRERSLLLLADGRPLAELQAMYNGVGAEMVAELLRQGYLAEPVVANAPGSASGSVPGSAPAPSQALRSLAGTRMYLFDICERMFSRRHAELAQRFRDALRSARDRDSMLDVGEALLDEITVMAGAQRAASVRERMEQLLPAG